MTTEEKTKKNPTYQAINQTNAPEVKEALASLHTYKTKLAEKTAALKALNPDMYAEIELLENCVAEETANIKSLIQKYGSYQDAEAGEYALIYERKTPVYDAQAFKARYPQFTPAVIVEAVNPDALKGLIKGGLLKQEELEADALKENGLHANPVITYKTAQCTVIQ